MIFFLFFLSCPLLNIKVIRDTESETFYHEITWSLSIFKFFSLLLLLLYDMYFMAVPVCDNYDGNPIKLTPCCVEHVPSYVMDNLTKI